MNGKPDEDVSSDVREHLSRLGQLFVGASNEILRLHCNFEDYYKIGRVRSHLRELHHLMIVAGVAASKP
jgi:hypothetical protein